VEIGTTSLAEMENAPRGRMEAAKPAEKAENGRSGGRSALLRWLPLTLVLLALVVLYAAGLDEYFSFEALHRYQGTLLNAVADRPIVAAAAYLAVYIVVVAVSFPGAGVLTITGGFLFGALLGTALALVAATAGATLIFLITRTSLGALLAERAGPRTQKLRRGFQEEGFSYLLFLRLVPLFPFWLVNLAAALFGMPLLTYVVATAVGSAPATFVFAYFGHSLGTALDGEGPHVPAGLLVALALLGVMALVPIVVRRWRRGGGREQSVPTRSGHE
jgi:uncharacterized membrane protein YdjX (TVP38/TMEM64 family)